MSGRDKITPEEIEKSANTTHILDDKTFTTWVKKVIKDKKIRVNIYTISNIIDGKMLKVQVEKFTVANKAKGVLGGISMGTRVIKGYLSETMCGTLVALLDAIPIKTYQDTRTGKMTVNIPQKIVKTGRDLREIDLNNLWQD